MDKVQRFSTNTFGRDFVCGDVHGCLEDLLLALKALNFNESVDRLFSVGDLIDRGPNSFECAQLIYKDWFHAVKGNHEDMMILSLVHGNSSATQTWLGNGGNWIYKPSTWDLAYSNDDLVNLACDLDKRPLVIVVGEGEERFNIVHAEFFRYGATVGDADIDNWTFGVHEMNNLLWGRTIIHNTHNATPHKDLSLTFVGHTPLRRITRVAQQIYIDTGCVYFHTNRNTNEQNTLSIACPTVHVVYSWSPLWKRISSIAFNEIPMEKL